MPTQGWIACGQATYRVELLGQVEAVQPQGDTGAIPAYSLSSIAGIRVRNLADLSLSPEDHIVTQLQTEEIFLENPLPLTAIDVAGQQQLVLAAIPDGTLILEGLDAAEDPFLGLVDLSGWKLVLETLDAQRMRVGWYLVGDWRLDTHPDYYPGATLGEVSFLAAFGGGSPDQALQTEIPWPFARDGRLPLDAPTRPDGTWSTPVRVAALTSIFDISGPALKDLPVSQIDAAALVKASDAVRLESGADADGVPFFRVRAAITRSLPCVAFAGLQLAPGGGELVLAATLGLASVSFRIDLTLSGGSTLDVISPFLVMNGDSAQPPREIVTLLPPRSTGPIAPPDLRIALAAPPGTTFPLARVDIPARWDSVAQVHPTDPQPYSLLGLVPGGVDGSRLIGYRFGALSGDAPRVQLEIRGATPDPTGIVLEVALTVQTSSDPADAFELSGTWRFQFDARRLALVPARSIHISGPDIRVMGLTITGLRSLGVSWEGGSLALSATGLRAFFDRISDLSDPSDPSRGFELDVPVLRVDSGGLDLELALTGGVTRLQGIGEAFKGTRGGVSIVDSKLMTGFLTAEGPLPHLDNATGSVTVLFKDGLQIAQASAEFQLGLHRRVDWWLELDLKSVRLDLVAAPESGGRVALILMITGKITFRPPGPSSAIAAYLEDAQLEFKDLVVTKAFDSLPAGLSLSVHLAQPWRLNLLGVFAFEIRGIGLGRGVDAGQGALSIDGQIFFSARDLLSVQVDFHKLTLQKPEDGSLIPRVGLESLEVRFEYKPTLKLYGFVSFVDTPERKGFSGGGQLIVSDAFGLSVLLEFVRARRPSDGAMLRVWMVYAELLSLEIPLEPEFALFLRDVGIGFGWRKTLATLDDPTVFLQAPGQRSRTYAPHLLSSWIDDLEGPEDSPRWTVVMSAWLTIGAGPRGLICPLVFDLLFILRSDLTIFSGVHGWVFNSLDHVRDSGARPVLSGLVHFSMRDRQFLISMITDPAAAAARGIPPAIGWFNQAFNFTLEAGRGRFRLELGWPRELMFYLVIPGLPLLTGWAGLLVRVVNGALTVGLGLEIGLAFATDTDVDLGVFGFSISASGRLSVYGEILARIGSSPAMFGSVGVNAFVILQINAWVHVKIGFFRLSLSFSFGFALILTARVSFGISTGFGLEGYAGVSLRIWKFQAGGTVALAINRGALDEARRRVIEGATAGPSDGALPAGSARLLPAATGELPVVAAENPQWTVFHIQRDDRVYVLLLPADDSWFATPPSPTQVVPQTGAEPQYQYAKSASADYEIDLRLQGIARVDHLGNPDLAVPARGDIHISYRCDWNLVIPPLPGTSAPGQAGAEPLKLGDWFFERPVVYDELRVIEAIVDDPRYRPELLTDWRVRAEPGAQDSGNAAGVRPDVRLPQFGDDDELYDLALEDAFGPSADDAISWDRIALGMTRWLSEDRSKPFRDYVDGMFSQVPAGGGTTPKLASPVERTYAAAAQLRRNRSALVARLLMEFRDWAIGAAPDGKPGPLLTACGLAFDGKVDPAHAADWSLDVVSLTVHRGYDGEPATGAGGVARQAVHRLVADPAGSQLRDAHIAPQQGGLGFQRARHQYRIRDILEFQDRDGMHFSWLLECIDDQGASAVMSPEELSGLVHRDSQFEHFDHYEVERVNVSQQARDGQQAGSVVEFSLRPGFVPSFLDLGAGDHKFFLVAPRFEFSDHFAAPAAVGDLLVYRITALDVFGNRSQTTEYLTARKRLDPPSPPESVLAAYTVDLTATAVASERIEITVAPGRDAAAAGGAVRHEIWTRPRPIADGGYYATGDDTAEIASDDNPTIDPRGMTRVGDLPPGATSLVLADLAGFRPGTVYEFHARAVSPDGNASRLVRSRQTAHITAGARAIPDRPRAYLERIPPPAITAAWLSGAELRAEVQTTAEPRPDRAAATGFARAAVDDLTQRELTLRMLHQPYLDAGQRHPTGGYVVTVRDRDATASDDPASYRRLGEIEVISAARYGTTPPSSEPWSKWHGRYLQAGESPSFRIRNASGDGDDLAWLDWGPDQPYASADSLGVFPEGTRIHVILSEILAALQARAGGLGYRVAIRQGRPGADVLAGMTYPSLQDAHAEAKDPHGSGLLKVLGRSVDLAVGNDAGAMPVRDLLDALTAIVAGLAPSAPGATSSGPGHDQVWLEVLLNGDRRTAMSYYRLSVQPRLRALPPEPGEARRAAFQSFTSALARAFARDDGSSLPGLLDATQDSYEALTRRFLRQRPLHDGEPPPVALGVAFYDDGGSFARPRGTDDTIAIQLYYTEPYARRFAYRVQRLSRYLPLYRELGLSVDPDPPAAPPDELATVLARLPRVKPPAAPAARFLGNFLRDGVACSEWIVEAHDEEGLVQSSETLRNRLGYRGAAWSLFSEVMTDWDVWSGWRRLASPTASWVAWSGDRTWADRGAAVDDGRLPGPSAGELAVLRSDAAWPEPAPALPRTAGLAGHPFTGLLLPKGMVVRVPKLPYYHRYRMGVFARTDDVDSTVRLVDASPVLPSRVPTVDPASAGWAFNAAGRLEVWWRVPSVWDSLDDTERALWVNEQPFATRLWDFDLRYALQIRRFKGDPLFETLTPLVAVELAHPASTSTAPRDLPGFVARTAGTSLSWDHPGSVEERALTLDSPFLPRLRLTAAGSIASGFQSLALAATDVFQALAAEFDFVIELHCSRAYGRAAPTVTTLSRAPGGSVP
jgi:hypothetical protein